jgi:sugar/nucleoside kinase (ribokinase family)
VGGLLFSLAEQNITPNNMNDILASQVTLKEKIKFTSVCGAHALQWAGAIISLPNRLDMIT